MVIQETLKKESPHLASAKFQHLQCNIYCIYKLNISNERQEKKVRKTTSLITIAHVHCFHYSYFIHSKKAKETRTFPYHRKQQFSVLSTNTSLELRLEQLADTSMAWVLKSLVPRTWKRRRAGGVNADSSLELPSCQQHGTFCAQLKVRSDGVGNTCTF